ncbi:unnamed protein product [Triticum aestivum]|uniref:(bread wheat) hypothetical protein n=1 Tax=Triticum aestivum TaxID=4565 RepID=A0A7G2IG23_WHEAT|nr:unnamed protein product [Triticum aestivum]
MAMKEMVSKVSPFAGTQSVLLIASHVQNIVLSKERKLRQQLVEQVSHLSQQMLRPAVKELRWLPGKMWNDHHKLADTLPGDFSKFLVQSYQPKTSEMVFPGRGSICVDTDSVQRILYLDVLVHHIPVSNCAIQVNAWDSNLIAKVIKKDTISLGVFGKLQLKEEYRGTEQTPLFGGLLQAQAFVASKLPLTYNPQKKAKITKVVNNLCKAVTEQVGTFIEAVAKINDEELDVDPYVQQTSTGTAPSCRAPKRKRRVSPIQEEEEFDEEETEEEDEMEVPQDVEDEGRQMRMNQRRMTKKKMSRRRRRRRRRRRKRSGRTIKKKMRRRRRRRRRRRKRRRRTKERRRARSKIVRQRRRNKKMRPKKEIKTKLQQSMVVKGKEMTRKNTRMPILMIKRDPMEAVTVPTMMMTMPLVLVVLAATQPGVSGSIDMFKLCNMKPALPTTFHVPDFHDRELCDKNDFAIDQNLLFLNETEKNPVDMEEAGKGLDWVHSKEKYKEYLKQLPDISSSKSKAALVANPHVVQKSKGVTMKKNLKLPQTKQQMPREDAEINVDKEAVVQTVVPTNKGKIPLSTVPPKPAKQQKIVKFAKGTKEEQGRKGVGSRHETEQHATANDAGLPSSASLVPTQAAKVPIADTSIPTEVVTVKTSRVAQEDSTTIASPKVTIHRDSSMPNTEGGCHSVKLPSPRAITKHPSKSASLRADFQNTLTQRGGVQHCKQVQVSQAANHNIIANQELVDSMKPKQWLSKIVIETGIIHIMDNLPEGSKKVVMPLSVYLYLDRSRVQVMLPVLECDNVNDREGGMHYWVFNINLRDGRFEVLDSNRKLEDIELMNTASTIAGAVR